MISVSPRYSTPRAQARNGRRREVHAVDVHVHDVRAEPLGLGAEAAHQLRAVDALREARVVLDLAGEHQLAAGRGAREHDGLEVGARGVDGGGEPGRPGADDQDLGPRCGPRRRGRGRRPAGERRGVGRGVRDDADPARRSGLRPAAGRAAGPRPPPPKLIFIEPKGLVAGPSRSCRRSSGDCRSCREGCPVVTVARWPYTPRGYRAPDALAGARRPAYPRIRDHRDAAEWRPRRCPTAPTRIRCAGTATSSSCCSGRGSARSATRSATRPCRSSCWR